MDELKLIRDFRAGMPGPSEEARRQAREVLAARFEHRKGAFVFARFGRRQLLVAAAVLLLAGLLAGSALAFGDRLLDFIRGEPAPKSVQSEFARLDPHSVIPYFDYPTVIKGRITEFWHSTPPPDAWRCGRGRLGAAAPATSSASCGRRRCPIAYRSPRDASAATLSAG
jgi:hypothetical protein